MDPFVFMKVANRDKLCMSMQHCRSPCVSNQGSIGVHSTLHSLSVRFNRAVTGISGAFAPEKIEAAHWSHVDVIGQCKGLQNVKMSAANLVNHDALLHCWRDPGTDQNCWLWVQSVARQDVQAILLSSEAKQKTSNQLYAVKQQTLQKLQSAEDPKLRDQAREAFRNQEKTIQKLRQKQRQERMADETVMSTEEEAAPLLDDSEDALAEGLSDAVGLVMKVGHSNILLQPCSRTWNWR